jgi:hypothetical protein
MDCHDLVQHYMTEVLGLREVINGLMHILEALIIISFGASQNLGPSHRACTWNSLCLKHLTCQHF